MTADQVSQRRANIRCLELLDASYRAFREGDTEESERLNARAADVGQDTYIALIGGMIMGAVPSPERDPGGWADYIQANRDGLARLLEAKEGT